MTSPIRAPKTETKTRARFLAACLAAALTAACSLIVERESEQCETTADCNAKGGAFAGSVCSASKVCSPCERNEQCLVGGKTALCAKSGNAGGRCVDVFTPECTRLTQGTAADEDPRAILAKDGIVVIGALLKDDGAVDIHDQGLNSMRLALGDIITAGGIRSTSGPPRTIAALVCDSADEPLLRSARHLVDTIKVPAIIGPEFSGRVIRTASEVSVPGGALLIAPGASSPAITSLDDRGLVWRTAPSDALQAVPLRLQIPALEASLRSSNPQITTVKLAVVAKGDAYGTALSGLLVPPQGQDAPLLNGKPLDPSAAYFRSIVYPGDTGPREEDRKALDAFAPHIVVFLGTTEVVSDIVVPLEESGATANWNGGIRPEYLFADGARGEALLAAVKDNPELAKRVRGTVPAYRGSIYDAFVTAYRGAFGSGPSAFGTAGAFDATYVLAMSLATLDGKAPTGEMLAGGIGKLVSGERVEARFTELAGAFARLRAGSSVNLAGASGALDFDLATGEALADIDVWCISGGSSPRFESSGAFFVATTRALEGIYACPE